MRYLYLFIIIISLPAEFCYAQPEALIVDKTWEVLECQGTFLKKNFNLYHKDSISNVMDYSQTHITFHKDHTFNAVLKDKISDGNWSLSAKVDTLYMNEEPNYLYSLSADSFTISSYSMEYKDTSGTLDTVFYYLKFAQVTITSVTTLENIGSMSIYPNPVKNSFIVEFNYIQPSNTVSQLQLFTLSGQKIKSLNLNGKESYMEIDISDRPAGIYILKVIDSDNKEIARKKVMKE